MYCVRKIKDDLYWVGADDRRLAMFEGIYHVPNGVSYNSYILLGEKTVLFDTVDKAVGKVFFENVGHVLAGRKLDYIIIHHMEPDHTAVLVELFAIYPETKVVCNTKTLAMIKQFFSLDVTERAVVVGEGDTLDVGNRSLTFYMAPMVHWPEVMVTYDPVNKALFSADAFGTFGALNGAIFADEFDFDRNCLDECRRYYTNIVGKYGVQVQALLKKASALDIQMICPLHGPVWRENLDYIIDKHTKWASYMPEETGVVIAYASVYGDTENAANIVSVRLREKGVKTVMFDVSVTDSSVILAQSFKYSHLIFASTTYNTGIFIKMDELLRDIAAHNLKNRTIGFIQNGSWAPTSGKLMRELLTTLGSMNFIEVMITLKSSLKKEQNTEIDAFTESIIKTINNKTIKE